MYVYVCSVVFFSIPIRIETHDSALKYRNCNFFRVCVLCECECLDVGTSGTFYTLPIFHCVPAIEFQYQEFSDDFTITNQN